MEGKYITHKAYSLLRKFNYLLFCVLVSLVSCQNEYENGLKGTLWYEYVTLDLTSGKRYIFSQPEYLSGRGFVFYGINGDFYHCLSNSSNELSCYSFKNDTDIYYAHLNWSIEGNIVKNPYGTHRIKHFDDSIMVLHQFYVRRGDTTYSDKIRTLKKVDLKRVKFKNKHSLSYLYKDFFQIDGFDITH